MCGIKDWRWIVPWTSWIYRASSELLTLHQLLSVAEEIHPSVDLGTSSLLRHRLEIDPFWDIWLGGFHTGPISTVAKGHRQLIFPPEISGCCSDSERLVIISVHNSRLCNHSTFPITMGILLMSLVMWVLKIRCLPLHPLTQSLQFVLLHTVLYIVSVPLSDRTSSHTLDHGLK